MFTNLRELIQSMPDEQTCRDYMAEQRWKGKPICPYCGCGIVYRIEKGKRYKCGNKECYKKFSVITGTVFEASNVAVSKWLTAVYLVTAHKKGISSYQLGKDIGVSQKAAWFMLHRIRELMRVKDSFMLDNIVEIDETFVGGKVKNMKKSRRAKLRTENSGTIQNKIMVVGMLERGGYLKLIALGKETGSAILHPLVRDNVDKDAVLITDSSANYEGLNKEYAGHEVINHSNDEYVRDGVIHTNSIEGAFGMLKRSIIGIYHQVTPKHLSRYCDETMFRYNLRKMRDNVRFEISMQNTEGRLKYKDLIKKVDAPLQRLLPESPIISEPHSNGKGTPVYQLKDGKRIARYNSIKEASQMTGIKSPHISRVLANGRHSAGGFTWEYAE